MSQLEKVLSEGMSDEAINELDTFAKKLSDGKLTTTQLRKFFGALKRVEANFDPTLLAMLRPQLAYAVGRSKGKEYYAAMKSFSEKIDFLLRKMGEEKDFDKIKSKFLNFVKIVETIVAYHKYHEPLKS